MNQFPRSNDLGAKKSGRVAVVINPTAGRGQAGRQVPAIRKLLGDAAADWSWFYTERSGDAEVMARKAAQAGASTVVAVGGDGTLHEVVNGTLNTGATLGLIPFGTGNDFARAVNLNSNIEAACDAILHGDTIYLDIGVIKGTGTGGERHFIVLAGTGFDARTAQTVNTGVRWLTGAPAYIYGALATLRQFEPFDLTLTVDGVEIKQKAMFVSIANAPTTGGGMRIAPDAAVDDGIFDICLVGHVSKATLVYQLTQVFKGAHVRHPKVTMLRAKEILLDADPKQPLLIDGEVIGTTPARISIRPGSIQMKVPRRGGADTVDAAGSK